MSIPNYTIPLTTFIKSHLRHDDKYPIDAEQAEILLILSRNLNLIHIQYPDEFSIDQTIYLWSYKAWMVDVERNTRVKAYAHKDRVQRYLFESNVEEITKGAMKHYGLDKDRARSMAWKWVKESNHAAIKIVSGIEKLKTKEEEL